MKKRKPKSIKIMQVLVKNTSLQSICIIIYICGSACILDAFVTAIYYFSCIQLLLHLSHSPVKFKTKITSEEPIYVTFTCKNLTFITQTAYNIL
jgi:hypothetical protein